MPERADSAKVFYINNPEVLDLIGFSDRKETLYSFNDLKGSLTKIEDQSALARQVDRGDEHSGRDRAGTGSIYDDIEAL